jgi:glutamate-ammonia-ligase adenylyltransferase
VSISSLALPESLRDDLFAQLVRGLPECPDPAMAITNFARFLGSMPRREEMLASLRGGNRTTESLLQLFSSSQYLSDLIIDDPQLVDWLRGGAVRYDRDGLFELLWKLMGQEPDADPSRTIRRFRNREMLRIGYNDIVRRLPLEVITQDLSHLAEACIEAACRVARARIAARHGEARGADGRPLCFVVLALGKLGGEELNYSSDIDLMFLYEKEGQTSGRKALTNTEYFARLGTELIHLLTEHSSSGQAYRVDMRLRPEGQPGALARSLASTIGYYETSGRTWERQALIKGRPVAGDLSLGREFLDAITPFVYRRFLSAAEIFEIKAMKRRIEARTRSAGDDLHEVKTGRGGIRDVEFVVQFLQLLHGGQNPEVRHPNTLNALAGLEKSGCLTAQERGVMEENYRFLRAIEHRLQILFDRQTHSLPRSIDEQLALARRLEYHRLSRWENPTGPVQRFLSDYATKTDLSRRILNHLLHDAFGEDGEAEPDAAVDLVLDPAPSAGMIADALGRFPFRDPAIAYRHLMALAREDFEFLSQPRCRHFLAAIAPALLRAVAATADPDLTLTNLEKISASLGAKAILWELFSFNVPSLRLYVEICANSPMLSEVLINNPGMIDDLIDSLVVDRPQSSAAIREELADLCRGAEDLGPILQSFRNKEWLRIGTRDLLGREPIREVSRELADVAEAIVRHVAHDEWARMRAELGRPHRDSDGKPARWAILGLGKLGGRELLYHSDVDVIFLYDEDGRAGRDANAPTGHQFFSRLAQRVIKRLEGGSDAPFLYRVDARLRPHGSSGPLALPLDSFRAYYATRARAWERLALTRARVVYATGVFGRELEHALQVISSERVDVSGLTHDVVAMRERLDDVHGPLDLQRGRGGLFDIEFLVQYLQAGHAWKRPGNLKSNVWDALEALTQAGVIGPMQEVVLREAYECYRGIESRLRIVRNQTEARLPETTSDLAALALRLGYDAPDRQSRAALLRGEVGRSKAAVRRVYDELVGTERVEGRRQLTSSGEGAA